MKKTIYYGLKSAIFVVTGIYVVLILAVMPFYHQEGYTHIGSDKSYFFRMTATYTAFAMLVLLLAVGAAGILAGIKDKERRRFSITDYFAFGYGVSVVLSYCFSDYKEEAFWGVQGWYMGMLPQLLLVGSYFAVSRLGREKRRLLLTVFPVSAVVFLLGYINRFGIYPFDMKIQNPEFISTIGNINWYCGYLVSVFFAGLCLLWQGRQEKKWQKLILSGYVLLGFATLITNGSSSGMPALLAVLFVMLWLSAKSQFLLRQVWKCLVLFSAAGAITFILQKSGWMISTYQEKTTALFTETAFPFVLLLLLLAVWPAVSHAGGGGSSMGAGERVIKAVCVAAVAAAAGYLLLLLLNTAMGGAITNALGLPYENPFFLYPEWGSYRGATWAVGAGCFGEQNFLHKLFGVGPDCMSCYLYYDGSDRLYRMVSDSFGTAALTNAHNEWLTVLVNNGLLGLVSYAGMMLTAIVRFIRSRDSAKLAAACGFCVLAYTVNNMFSFQQSMGAATIFIMLGFGENEIKNLS